MPRDQLIRMAIRIQRQLGRPFCTVPCEWDKSVSELLQWAGVVQRQLGLARTATQHGWYAAAAHKQQHALTDLRLLDNAIERLHQKHPPSPFAETGPSLRTIVEELRQLKDEFEDFEIDLKQGLIGVTTEPIELDGLNLGPFSIELHVNRLAERVDSDCFKLMALEPNPASSHSGTVHPHVQDNRVCAGDASVPIRMALEQGRIADAFILIRSVLMSYNEDSPYVALENWHGEDCAECGYSGSEGDMSFCEGCDRNVCEGCYSMCDLCEEGCCRSCLEKDSVSDNRCCPGCREYCSACNRTVDKDSFDDQTELCPGCLAKQQTIQEQETNHEDDSDNPIREVTLATPATATPAAA